MPLSTEQSQALLALEDSLAEQVRQVAAGRYEQLLEIMQLSRPLLEALSPLDGEPDEDDRNRLQRIQSLHRRVQATLHDQRAETKSQLQRISHGRTGLRAYGSSRPKP
ncbi:MAG: hypothetical protein ACOCZE_10985 [Planctomycetota bacterium]